MRRAIVLALVVAAASVVRADTTLMLQVGFMGDTRAHSNGIDITSQGFTSVGLNLSSFSGERLGRISAVSMSVPLKKFVSVNGAEVPASLAVYDAMIDLDALLGVGYRFSWDQFEMILGAGTSAGGLAFGSYGSFGDSMVTCVVGAGASINVLGRLDNSTGLSMSVLAGYDFIEFYHFPQLTSGTSFVGGFRLALTLGMYFG